MSNENFSPRLEQIFRAIFELPDDAEVQHIRKINYPKWDSLAHVLLVSAIESEFSITVEIAKTLELNSFESMQIYLDGAGIE